MRIISGQYKSRIIQVPEGIRPTEDRVKKAFFDIMGDVSGLSCLELFAGSGSVGLEALSLGAGSMVFVEISRACVKSIQDNVKVFGLEDKVMVLAKDSLEAIKQLYASQKKFDLIYLDPPYYKGISEKALQILADCDILLPSGYIGVQHFKKDPLPEKQGDLSRFRQSKYGDSVLSFYKKGI
ncbi:MAG: 16S rRNA (guanine(966)-N(2))-methyltransferase RsmD [Candidatus Omnitrophica bacterium]|jgi:16S rRNA (guanine(966)-N(2))-methyltransferase RsmD|nr:16S rRNA (guanine(966)-N(2))-methyltransferase RsmD [Candidatus Omnitrophota bacterium]MDD5078845.1 16S rRNA (guanine(966)-N(2))-methyltransferase RsmD [Candidatus Omnitrophota bacterium]